jgi:outer membrane scaffolding protein for murein synthesis (MipA/OmpV family)
MIHRLLVSAALCAVAAPAFAQSGAAGELPDPNDRSNTFTIAAGVASVPDYEGSDDQEWIPAAAIRGRIGGMDFWTSSTWLYVDLIARPSGGGMDFDFGPIVGARFNRSGDVQDGAVDKLPELDAAIEIGAFGGVSWHGLTNAYDTLSLRVDVLHDVGGAHKSTLFTPSVTFATPLSRSTYLSASAMAEWAGGGYADYYYSITPAEGVIAGLPAYDADGGFKNWGVSLTGLQMVTGDLTGGIGVFGMVSYKHLGGDFEDSPIVDQRGDAGQLMGALGLTYTW